MEPSREDLLELLVRGEGLTGGARRKRRTRKGAVPSGLKKFQAFHKKHPNLTKKQASRAYQAQKKKRKKKGRGYDDEDEEDFEGFGMLGGADPSTISEKSSAWQTKNVKLINKYEKVGEAVMKLFKKHFPKEFNKQKKAVGAGIDHLDYVRFAKSTDQEKDFGQALRTKWNSIFADVVDDTKNSADRLAAGKNWLEPRENALSDLGVMVIKLANAEPPVKAYLLNEV